MMSNGPLPARPDGTVDAQWLFPQERAPPPRFKGCKHSDFGDLALRTSNGSQLAPSPPSSLHAHMALTATVFPNSDTASQLDREAQYLADVSDALVANLAANITAVNASLLAVDASLAKMAAHATATEAKLLMAPTRIGNTLACDRETGGNSSGTAGLARGSGVKNVIFSNCPCDQS